MMYKIEDIKFVEKPNYKKFIDLENQTFHRWKVLGYAGFDDRKKPMWWCQCSCENKTIKKIRANALRTNHSKSCDCLDQERKTKHGLRDSSEYNSYYSAKNRCENSNYNRYHDYGGRGIEFRFKDFEEFYAELGDKPEPKKDYSVERIDNDGHYERGNLKWATRFEQDRNRRDNIWLTYNNKIQCLADWAKEYNISYHALQARYKNNWCINCIFSLPENKKGRKKMTCIHK